MKSGNIITTGSSLNELLKEREYLEESRKSSKDPLSKAKIGMQIMHIDSKIRNMDNRTY